MDDPAKKPSPPGADILQESLNVGDLTNRYHEILNSLKDSDNYKRCVALGKPRPGHPEGTVSNHIRELEGNLDSIIAIKARLGSPPSEEMILRLEVLIHSHDTFKSESLKGVPIDHAKSHASLGAGFIRRLGADAALCQIAQLHDVPFSVWRKGENRREDKLLPVLKSIVDLPTFTLFQLIDNVTEGKSPASVAWFVKKVTPLLQPEQHTWDILRELLKEQTERNQQGERDKLQSFLARECGAIILQSVDDDSCKFVQLLVHHLRGYCDGSIDGLSENFKFALPPGWANSMIDLLRRVPSHLPATLSDADISNLMGLSGATMNHNELFNAVLSEEKAPRTILTQLIREVGRDELSENEKHSLAKWFVGVASALQSLQLSADAETAILMSWGGALTLYCED